MRERLRAVPLFANLADEALERLAAATSEFDAPAGQMLIERGGPGSGMFVLEHGRAAVEAPEGRRELGPGDIFGERSLVEDGVDRTARVWAETDVHCLAIGRAEVERLLMDEPRVADRLRRRSSA
jgi:CRP/FNR family transcriptional regulator, cyclic AMP receptor protein